jgi:hypothetical protein
MRDVQVFRQLNVDVYCKSGVFTNASNARNYVENASKVTINRFNGQEIWQNDRQGIRVQ